MRTTARFLMLLVVTAGGTTAPAAAAPSATHCPPPASGYVIWDVSAEPYAVDNFVDELGNGNGVVCARPLYAVDDGSGGLFQIYNFIDDTVASPR